MISYLAAIMAFAPAPTKMARHLALPKPADEFPWIPYVDTAPLMDAERFTTWCLEVGETGDYGRVALHRLADEFCCTEMRGTVQPPDCAKIFNHLKPAGWEYKRGPNVAKGGQVTRPTLYRINQYKVRKQ